MLTGAVIAESLHSDAQLDGKIISVARVRRVVVEEPADGLCCARTRHHL